MDEVSAAALPDAYDITSDTVAIGNEHFLMHMVRDSAALVDRIDPASFAIDERFPYWAELWASAIGLAHNLQHMDLHNRRVLELGCGLGLCGIMAVRRGAQVMMTDYEQDALAFAAANAAANLTADEHARCTVRLLDWRNPDTGQKFDVVIGADIVYERKNFAPLLALFRKVLAPGGTALLADPDRALGADFVTRATAEGWEVVTERTPISFKGIPVTVGLHTITAAASPSDGG